MTDEQLFDVERVRNFCAERELQRKVSDQSGGPLGVPVQELLDLARNNTTVANVLSCWKAGRFASFESALITAVVHLAWQNEELLRNATKSAMLAPPGMEFCRPAPEDQA